MGLLQRRKGAAGEREWFNLLSAKLGVTVKRLLGQARDGGVDGEMALTFGPGVYGIKWEVKRRQSIAAVRYLEQCGAGGPERYAPAVAMREDGGKWVVMMYGEDFLALLAELRDPLGLNP